MPDTAFNLVQVGDAATRRAAESLDREYLGWVASSAMQHFGLPMDIEAMLKSDMENGTKFFPPHGRFYLLQNHGTHGGIGCLKRLTPEVAELERMYVEPAYRGQGLGRLLLIRLLSDARAIGYHRVRLESLRFLTQAHALYHSVGFKDIDHYTESGMKEFHPESMLDKFKSSVFFMELDMPDAASPA